MRKFDIKIGLDKKPHVMYTEFRDSIYRMEDEKARTYGIDRVMTVDEIVASDGIELGVILTPANPHYGLIKQMLLSGKHVWTEKSMTFTLDVAHDLVDIPNEKNLYLGVAADNVLGAEL